MLTSIKSQRGSLLLSVLALSTMILIMVSSSLGFLHHMQTLTLRRRAGDEAFYAAESGIARALSYINSQPQGQKNPKFDVPFGSAFRPFGSSPQKVDVNESNLNASSNFDGTYVTMVFTRDTGGSNKEQVVRSTGCSTSARVPIYRRIEVVITPSTFARYAFFNTTSHSTIDGDERWLSPGEEFWGPVHSNRFLYVYGSSSEHLKFHSDVTIVRTDVRKSGTQASWVEYRGSKQTNAKYVELPTDLTDLKVAAAAGGIQLPQDDPYYAPNNDSNPNNNVAVPANSFNGKPIHNYEFKLNNTNVTITNLFSGTSFTRSIASGFNGAVVVNDGNAFVNGVIDGKMTIGALGTRASSPTPYNQASNGNIIVNGEIRYAGHPTSSKYVLNPDLSNCDDVLGLIAERNFALDADCPTNTVLDAHVMLTGQATTNPDVRNWTSTSGTTVNAARNQDGAFFIEDGNPLNGRVMDLSQIWSGLPSTGSGAKFDSSGNDYNQSRKFGDLFLNGGVVHFLRGQTADGSGGFDRRYSFDQRLMYNPPPFYPLTDDSEIIWWCETRHTGGTSFEWQES